jgi:hypothetical protein
MDQSKQKKIVIADSTEQRNNDNRLLILNNISQKASEQNLSPGKISFTKKEVEKKALRKTVSWRIYYQQTYISIKVRGNFQTQENRYQMAISTYRKQQNNAKNGEDIDMN